MPRDRDTLDILAWSHVHELRMNAEHVAALCRSAAPVVLPRGQRRREAVLIMRLRQERARNRKLLDLLGR